MQYHFAEDSLDDLLRVVLAQLLKSRTRVRPSKGWTTEIAGATLTLSKPRARLSRTELKGTVFSCLGELLWYLSGSNDVEPISYYIRMYKRFSDDGKSVYGGYGPRFFKKDGRIDQIANVISHLKRRPMTRQAVVQIFDAKDIITEHKDVPCTCTLQFMIRRDQLHMYTHMRSNDAFLGLPHDVFAFTMIQELIARSIGIGLGTYNHAVGSLHLYDEHRMKAHDFLGEGWQSSTSMPPMPGGDQWAAIKKLVLTERSIRLGRNVVPEELELPTYWTDVVRLLKIYKCFTRRDRLGIKALKSTLKNRIYHQYVDDKLQSMATRAGR